MKWSQLKILIAVEHHRKVGNKISIDTYFHVSSAVLTSEAFGTAIRAHWQTENNQHWLLDTLFQEDKQRMYDDGASILDILRRWALNLVKLYPAATKIRNSIEPVGVMISGKRLFLALVKKFNQPLVHRLGSVLLL
ncbi:Transposase [Shewanella baltica]|nr:Transposase [Shewanella baltica]